MKHLLRGILVYNDFMSTLTKDLFFMFISFILWCESTEFLTYELLIISRRRVNILAKDITILWGALPIPEMIGLKRISILWVFKSP